LGVKMDSGYDAFAWLLIVAGAATAAVGLWEVLRLGTREAFVPRRAGESCRAPAFRALGGPPAHRVPLTGRHRRLPRRSLLRDAGEGLAAGRGPPRGGAA